MTAYSDNTNFALEFQRRVMVELGMRLGREQTHIGKIDDWHPENIELIATARTGWPEAIRRALAAEAEVERLKDALISIAEESTDPGARACAADALEARA
ncbi:MAG: hypothetical protein WC749_02555 [Dehalococcoidia bacterium]